MAAATRPWGSFPGAGNDALDLGDQDIVLLLQRAQHELMQPLSHRGTAYVFGSYGPAFDSLSHRVRWRDIGPKSVPAARYAT